VSYDAIGADSGSIQCGWFAEEAVGGHEGEGGSANVDSQSSATEDMHVGASGHLGDGGYCCGEEEEEVEDEEEDFHSIRAVAEDVGCGEEETT
jgi:hypothetical protein